MSHPRHSGFCSVTLSRVSGDRAMNQNLFNVKIIVLNSTT